MANRRTGSEEEPVIRQILASLAADISARPTALRPVTADWVDGLSALVEDVVLDLDAALPDDKP